MYTKQVLTRAFYGCKNVKKVYTYFYSWAESEIIKPYYWGYPGDTNIGNSSVTIEVYK